jgi:hypothetical protein
MAAVALRMVFVAFVACCARFFAFCNLLWVRCFRPRRQHLSLSLSPPPSSRCALHRSLPWVATINPPSPLPPSPLPPCPLPPSPLPPSPLAPFPPSPTIRAPPLGGCIKAAIRAHCQGSGLRCGGGEGGFIRIQ